MRSLSLWQSIALLCRVLCFLAGCLAYGMLHPRAPQPWALLKLPLRNTPCFQREQHVLPITRCGWLGVGEAAVSFSSKHFASFSSTSQLSLRSMQARHFWRQPNKLPAAPISLEPSTSLFSFFLQDTILLELAGRKQKGFQAIFHTCNGAEPLFCQKVFYVFYTSPCCAASIFWHI